MRTLKLEIPAFLLEQVLIATTNIGMHAWKPHLEQIVLNRVVSLMPADTIQVLFHLAIDQVDPSVVKLFFG